MAERKFLAIFVIVGFIFAITFITILMLFLPAISHEKENLAYYKSTGLQIHNDLQGILQDAKSMLPSTADINLDDADEIMRFNINLSLIDDLAWIAEQEGANYEKLKLATSYEDANKYVKKELACSVMVQYILLLSMVFEDTGLALPEEELLAKYNETAEKLLQSQEKLKISDELLEGFREEFGLKVEEIKPEVEELFAGYVKHVASKFALANSTKNRERAYVEAKKILTIAQT